MLFKKFLAFILAAAMVFVMAVPAFAWDSNDISISDDRCENARNLLLPIPGQANAYYLPIEFPESTSADNKDGMLSFLSDFDSEGKVFLVRVQSEILQGSTAIRTTFLLCSFKESDYMLTTSGSGSSLSYAFVPKPGVVESLKLTAMSYVYHNPTTIYPYQIGTFRDNSGVTYVFSRDLQNDVFYSNRPEFFHAQPSFIKDAVIQPILKSSIPAESHNLTINYLDESGSQIAEPHTRPVESGAAYSVNSPTIPGYTPDKAVVSGTMGNGDITETVTYRKNTHSVTVNYQFEDGGKAADSVSQSVKYGETYNIQSPAIPGHTPDKLVVTGTMEDKDLTVTVTYVENPIETKQLTIHYVYEDGSTAADSYTGSLPVGYPYEVVSPPVPGYGADIPIVSGTMPGEDKIVTVTYSAAAYQLTVNYLFEDGSKAADSVQQSLLAGTAYRLESPAVDGFKPDKAVVSGSMPSRDYSVTVMYYPDYSGGGGSGDNEEKPDSSNPFEPPPDSYWNELFGDYQFHSPFAMPDWMKGEAGDSGNENPDDNFWDQFLGDYQFHNPFIMPDWMKGTADKGELFALPVEDFYRQLYGNYQWG